MADGTVPTADVRTTARRATTRRRLRVPIATALALAFGTLVFVGVAGVLGVGMWSARQNTAILLGDKADLSIDVLVANLRRHLDPVALANGHLADLIGRGEVDTDDPVQLADYMRGAMAATPNVVGMAFIDTNLQVVRVSRANRRVGVRISDWSNNPQGFRTLDEARATRRPYWGELFRSQDLRATLLNRRAPLWRNGRFLGVLVSAVTVAELSRSLSVDEEDETLTRFIIYGRDHVLAHFAMIDGGLPRSENPPLPRLDQIGDPVLARIWDPMAQRSGRLPVALTGVTQGHRAEIDGVSYLLLYRELEGYAQAPLQVGAYTRLDEAWLSNEIDRLLLAGIVGLVILIASVVAALYLGRRMTRPIRALALAAERVSALDLSDPPRLAESRLVELDQAGEAFNAMVAGLGWFETYVPRAVVRQLLAAGGRPAVVSEERPVTVLFTDIRGFAALAQSMSAAETAAFLNRHFSLIAACVEAEEGTVDKYMGDSMMAFWGAPRADPDHVERTCRAALSMRRAIMLDNERRATRDEPPLRLGIGIHTGTAIVGNIGAPGRINYTLVGDTVNIAQRLEELSKEVADPQTVEILVSREVAERLGKRYGLKEYGAQRARGREGVLEVLRLE
jgi:class 3 adenylate cyclase